ncbi:histidine kinase dimerization/phospho-acceptor domain-containing protein [Desulfoluna spongiiphila]|uniref:histidine kinase n=1 Tax=Desulfoluna spongiiphila TaxID=419481 RepID=A0A1G5HAL5_9BACT|nr:histidine kinase dimerization/phospho-acceptor domain-containing protein [Desulfoluna spongiiphila]SCY60757.1 hypothetical protein SAMN05216233_11353 [Desulfoluna spongiiphila]
MENAAFVYVGFFFLVLWLLSLGIFIGKSRKQSREIRRLETIEEKYRNLFENMTGAYAMGEMMYDDGGSPVDFLYVAVNSAFEAMFSMDRRVVEGKRLSEVFPGVDQDEPGWLDHFAEVVRTGEGKTLKEYSDALKMWFYINVFYAGGERFVTVFTDITPLMDAERLTGALALAGAASHELSQPLQAALGYAELIELKAKEGPCNESLLETVGRFSGQVERIKEIASQLRSVSRYRTKGHAGCKPILDLAGSADPIHRSD